MTARILDFLTTTRGLIAGLAAVVAGALTFVVIAVLAVALPAVSGSWLVLPSAVMVLGVLAAGAWLVFGGGAARFEPAPVAEQEWHWGGQPR